MPAIQRHPGFSTGHNVGQALTIVDEIHAILLEQRLHGLAGAVLGLESAPRRVPRVVEPAQPRG